MLKLHSFSDFRMTQNSELPGQMLLRERTGLHQIMGVCVRCIFAMTVSMRPMSYMIMLCQLSSLMTFELT